MKRKIIIFYAIQIKKRRKKNYFAKYRQIERIDASLELDQPFETEIKPFWSEQEENKKKRTHIFIIDKMSKWNKNTLQSPNLSEAHKANA